MDLTQITSDKELFNLLEEIIRSNNKNEMSYIFKDAIITDALNYKEQLLKLLNYSVMIYDYIPMSMYISPDYKTETIKRTYFSALIKNDDDLLEEFSKRLSLQNLIICVHYHLMDDSYIYKNGKKNKWATEEIIISYNINYDSFGNPSIKLLEHIWDYGSDVYELVEQIEHGETKNAFINNYIQITVCHYLHQPVF